MQNPFQPSLFIKLITAFAAIAITASPVATAAEPDHGEGKQAAAFHAVLAPLWHAPAGKERTSNACAKSAQLDLLAKAIPTENAAGLQEVTAMFKEKCASSPQDAEAVFGKLHDAFHKVSEHKE